MKNKYLTIYSISVLAIFVVTILCFSISLYSEYSGGYLRTRKTFDSMNVSVKTTLQTTSEYSTDFQPKLEAAIGSLDDYAALEILKNGALLYSYYPRAAIPQENTNMIKLYYDTYKIGNDGIYIQAAMYTLRPAKIVKNARISFIIILVFTAITIMLIIYLNVFTKESTSTEIIMEPDEADDNADLPDQTETEETEYTEEYQEEDAETEQKDEFEEYDNNPPEYEDTAETETETSDEMPETDGNTVSETTKNDIPPLEESAIGIKSEKDGEFEAYDIPVIEGDFSDTESEEETEPEETASADESEKDASAAENNAETKEEEKAELPVDDVKPAKIEEENPQGLFSPETGFGWESYLVTRLDNELVRASSLEFDLILFLIKIKNISRQAEEIKSISEMLVNSFQFKDLIFEYKDDCFAAIKTNCSIDDAIPLADKLHSDISTVISEAGGKCYIGMTSRTIRIVSAERLIKEADAALVHAQEEEDSPIIAFRANAEKYLEFVDKKDR